MHILQQQLGVVAWADHLYRLLQHRQSLQYLHLQDVVNEFRLLCTQTVLLKMITLQSISYLRHTQRHCRLVTRVPTQILLLQVYLQAHMHMQQLVGSRLKTSVCGVSQVQQRLLQHTLTMP